MSDTFGPLSPQQFATYDPATSSWRMSGATYLWDSGPFSGTWPPSGMTRSGVSSELRPPAHLTDESACSSLLKTPTANLATNGGSQHPDKRKAGGHGPTLADEIEHLLPAETAMSVTALRGGLLLPTPTARDWKDNTVRREPRRPNDTDTLARALTGVNTPPLSAAGSASPATQLPGQLSLLDELAESA